MDLPSAAFEACGSGRTLAVNFAISASLSAFDIDPPLVEPSVPPPVVVGGGREQAFFAATSPAEYPSAVPRAGVSAFAAASPSTISAAA